MRVDRLFREAAAPILERIRRDRDRCPAQVRSMLEHLHSHLFDPDLDAKRWLQACNIRDKDISMLFRDTLSLPPYGYLEDCRMKVACRLLKGTDLSVWKIASLLGYSAPQVFSRAFHRWAGLPPSIFRRNATAAVTGIPDVETLQKAVRGGLDKKEADVLYILLAELYPDSFPPQTSSK